ncbi:MAG TPA: hypothetical protein VFR41_11000, partial [Acidimicrobiia bacterium]|nr:hypothetical protein [Acidimicrobiia bacterium]
MRDLVLAVAPYVAAGLVLGGCALVAHGLRARRVAAFLCVVALVAGVAVGANAGPGGFVATFTDSLTVNAKNPFDPKPTCRWTGLAEVTVGWAADPDATSYDILRSDSPNAGYASIANVGAGVTSYADATVNPSSPPQGQYYYKVQTNKVGGNTTTPRYASSTAVCPGYVRGYAGGPGHDVNNAEAATSTSQSPTALAISGTTMYVTEKGIVHAIDLNNGLEHSIAGQPGYGEYGDGGPATLANFGSLSGVAVDSGGNQYVSDGDLGIVRKISVGGTITVFAGADGTCLATDPCGDGGAATSAFLAGPASVAVDSSDNVYIADRGHNRIRMVSAANGHISTVAGTGTVCDDPTHACGDGGNATDADLNGPSSIAIDEHDNLYIADTGDRRVREVAAANGHISAFVGNGGLGAVTWDADGGAIGNAQMSRPTGILVDGGAIYVTESNRVRKFAGGTVTTAIGTGGAGTTADGTPAADARLEPPYAIVRDAAGNMYLGSGSVVEVVTPDGKIGRFAGGGGNCNPINPCGDGGPARAASLGEVKGLAIDDVGNLYIADDSYERIRRVSPSGYISTFAGSGVTCPASTDVCGDGGNATAAKLHRPTDLVWGGDALYVSDAGDRRVRKIATSGEGNTPGNITTVAGTGVQGDGGDGGDATDATLDTPAGLAYGDAGHIYVADRANHRVRVFADGGTIDAFAGDGAQGSSGDGGNATDAQLWSPVGLFLDGGTLYITDYDAAVVRKVVAGTISNVAGNGFADSWTATQDGPNAALFKSPTGLSWDANSDTLYIADPDLHVVFAMYGGVGIVAGDGIAGFDTDGPSSSSRLDSPVATAVDASGDVFIADMSSNRIVELQFGFSPVVYAGTGDASFEDATIATQARFGGLGGIARAANGDIYVADPQNRRIRKISAAGVVTTVAGTGAASTYGGDGGPNEAARFDEVYDIARDRFGNVYFAEAEKNWVRVLRADGTVHTFAGDGHQGYTGDSGPADEAELNSPQGLAVDAAGNVYIADTNNNVIRKVDTSGIITTIAGTGGSGCIGDGGDATAALMWGPMGLALD